MIEDRPRDDLRVALVQRASSLDPKENREALESLVPADQDLVVLPEAWARDFGKPGSPLGEFAEPLDGPFATELERVARERGATVVAGMFEPGEDDRPYNTLVARGPGHAASYRKIHLYDSFGYKESDTVSAGPTELVPQLELDGWSLGLMTCYDLRFPEQARALVAAGAEVLVLPAAWVAGERKVEHWRTLVRARAIENTSYVVAVGQPGPRYSGHSMVVDPFGDIVVEAGDDDETLTAVLEPDVLEKARETNPSLRNRRL
ncbi:carbon-nitrogen hydrolase family protein [Nocardioides rotundus]|uniref:carbon-nitrogen hydrolase family protein n=1 Tax=Nocardioides rotundus TaxID=1774216 RepID=UPI001CC0F58F|nr:carbon-nitrogen hydrolase family protein [Nocardioides rotundus]UAL29608.1 carbon-nitrogen hydrolase family protein [Nocardioides rotundus]